MNTLFDAFDDSHEQALPPGSDFTDGELTAARYELAMLTAEDAALGTSVVLSTCRGPVTIYGKRRGSRSLAARIAD